MRKIWIKPKWRTDQMDQDLLLSRVTMDQALGISVCGRDWTILILHQWSQGSEGSCKIKSSFMDEQPPWLRWEQIYCLILCESKEHAWISEHCPPSIVIIAKTFGVQLFARYFTSRCGDRIDATVVTFIMSTTIKETSHDGIIRQRPVQID